MQNFGIAGSINRIIYTEICVDSGYCPRTCKMYIDNGRSECAGAVSYVGCRRTGARFTEPANFLQHRHVP